MTFGKDFAFVGNQYHLEVYGECFFPDLLFFNRDLNALVVFELKTGDFKSIYLAQLMTYLRILDDKVRKSHENPSIGIVLCRNANKDFVKYVMAIDPELKRNKYGKGKYLLRHAFEQGDYLPEDILWREKAAFSDAVGHSMVDYLKAFAEKYFTDAEFEAENLEYDHARPFTKESLLYRELFEKYYPNQSQMIIDFWMPNKNWDGCNVNDPSARVLSNYGASGK